MKLFSAFGIIPLMKSFLLKDFLLERYESVVVIEVVSPDGPAAFVDVRKVSRWFGSFTSLLTVLPV